MTSKSPVGDISVVTLIRTDTTLDHSQEAEKVNRVQGVPYGIALSRLGKISAQKGQQEPKGSGYGTRRGSRNQRGVITKGKQARQGSQNQRAAGTKWGASRWQQLTSVLLLEKFCYG